MEALLQPAVSSPRMSPLDPSSQAIRRGSCKVMSRSARTAACDGKRLSKANDRFARIVAEWAYPRQLDGPPQLSLPQSLCGSLQTTGSTHLPPLDTHRENSLFDSEP